MRRATQQRLVLAVQLFSLIVVVTAAVLVACLPHVALVPGMSTIIDPTQLATGALAVACAFAWLNLAYLFPKASAAAAGRTALEISNSGPR